MDKLKPKMIVMDLDGTLLTDNGCVSAYTLSILEKCKEKNIKIGIATARSEYSCKRYIEQIKPNFSIVNGGAVTFIENSIFRKEFISKEIAYKIITELYGKNDVGEIHFDTEDEKYTVCDQDMDPNILYKEKYKYWNINKKIEHDLQKIRLELFNKDIYLDLKEKFTECDIVEFRGEDWHMIKDKNATKIIGLKNIIRNMQITIEDVVAFGDDYNDIEMIIECGIGIAMKNGINEIKSKANFVCGKNNNNGVGNWIVENIL